MKRNWAAFVFRAGFVILVLTMIISWYQFSNPFALLIMAVEPIPIVVESIPIPVFIVVAILVASFWIVGGLKARKLNWAEGWSRIGTVLLVLLVLVVLIFLSIELIRTENPLGLILFIVISVVGGVVVWGLVWGLVRVINWIFKGFKKRDDDEYDDY